ncbi:GAF domain-containing protein [Cochlodiniinecator piscidefendens]|uniref:GAF domain-containing protein n=1 Tax=Cochlodiniinecator piscidefendens TaxID=2715756 RepID=UPI001E5957C3|nr:GAF domain-containing protein [Cochlodiniinecator piscidefendens]
MIDTSDFLNAVASASDRSDVYLQAFEALLQQNVGARLFTLTTVDPKTMEYARFYSNMPDAYPVYGRKPADTSDWSNQVLRDRKTFVANSIEEIAVLLPDYALIQSLGCESIVNIPVEVAGRVIGTVNLLDKAGFYTPEKVARANALKLPAMVCFLLYTQMQGDTA